ncbi:uncharacterized protein B0I36DRAFT_115066 [Microdochium trichocladiopsis]|uniref:Coupling of ubiquitin conjugation to ER degradation protein 1 n=1 Tax=Microdochium trichocladiopsis TaxID=1682393 RepID=A0A9P8Y5T7_9PEZI|nr:uncharacterized protein B0I36DRAFT_115066 [Microdochium trichocladiopsis]KAH7030866.1 hypothetical protein B0I36DRAFT_115066 [Microdochium trichocladiopsis]
MADEQISLPSLLLIVVLGGLIVRYLFFSPAVTTTSQPRDAAAAARQRETLVERLQQMFPQVDRRTILWDLQRNGNSIAATTERILAGRMETPPVTFQPPPPPVSSTTSASSASQLQAQAARSKPAETDLITRYKLQNKVSSQSPAQVAEEQTDSKGKSWSSNREERQSALQRRRDEMIIAARRKMEAKIAAEKAAAGQS